MSPSRRRSGPASSPRPIVDFVEDIEGGTGYWGAGLNGRTWHITRAVTGWRLEFRDAGDQDVTFAGVHRTVRDAEEEAAR